MHDGRRSWARERCFMKMKTVSVIVPCYNAAQYLDKCIRQLLDQTIGIENIEIILVNDASTDEGKTWRIITEYERKFPDTIIAVSLEENRKQGGARNVGISYASGDYFIFCDADDWLLEETLEHCYNAAIAYEADVVEFRMCYVKDHDTLVQLKRGNGSRLIILDTENQRKEYLGCVTKELSFGSQKKLYKRSLICENHILFVEHLIFEEPSFVVPVRLYEKRHYFLDEELYVCYLSEDSATRSAWEKTHKWDNLKVWVDLIDDLAERGFLEKYYAEIEDIFFYWGYKLSLTLPLRQGCILSKEEIQLCKKVTLDLFPNIQNNKYVNAFRNEIQFFLLLELLHLDITDKVTKDANEALREYL